MGAVVKYSGGWMRAAWLAGLVVLGALFAPRAEADEATRAGYARQDAVLYAGHQVVVGHRDVPVIGRVETRTDTFLLAEVVHGEDGWVVSPRTCHVDMRPTAGVRIRMEDAVARVLPVVPFHLTAGRDGYWYAAPWQAGWGREDVDGDGHPGVTLAVSAPLCSGQVYVASTSWSKARVRLHRDAFEGEIRVRVHQRTLGASSGCLTLMSTDGRDRVKGTFRYERVPAGTTCDELEARGWPVHADDPGS